MCVLYFRQACEQALSYEGDHRCILFIDDLDFASVHPGGSSNSDDVVKRLFYLELEALFDSLVSQDVDYGFCSLHLDLTSIAKQNIRIIAATSRPTLLSDGINRLFANQVIIY